MANTLSTFALRHKYFQANIQQVLRKALVAEKICRVDNSDLKTIENPYLTASTPTIQAVAGTYSVATMTVTDDHLSVDNEVVNAVQVYDFEMRTANFNLIADFLDDLMYQTAASVDQFVLNSVLSQATGTYSTPTGGFGTAANISTIMGNLMSKIAGYKSGVAENPFLILEATDIVGFFQNQVGSGFTYADAALNNGFLSAYGGVEIYVVRPSTFVTASLGTLSATNSGHRLFGLKNLAVYASPRGVQYEEKSVTGKTGKEVVAYTLIGAKVWAVHQPLFVNITLN